MAGAPDEALLAIHVDTGEIVDCSECAGALLGVEPALLTGETWDRVLASEPGTKAVLAQAVRSGRRAALPPFLVRRQDGTEVVLGALLAPRSGSGSATTRLILWPLLDGDRAVPDPLATSDMLAVLGVHGLRCDEQWGVGDTANLMAEIHRSLVEIVRKSDTVGRPSATSVCIVMRGISEAGARDICRALLSHLHRNSRVQLSKGVRVCIGLAQRAHGASALSALLAANNALLRAQSGGERESIRVAGAEDYSLLVARALDEAGIFGGEFSGFSNTIAAGEKPGTTQTSTGSAAPPVTPIEKNIEGYVVDNMEGAVDQAVFLAQLDLPVAVIGPAGTGKMYIARIIHEESGGAADMLVALDCREFRSRAAAQSAIQRELARAEGKTLVFKSPHVMHPEVQLKLARQISTRRLADVTPPRYLPRVKLIALFPEPLELLVKRGELTEPLASAFAGYPITVPPINARKQAVLRWAHKILGQEGVLRDRDMKGFTPDAEQAMLRYDWPGNISEMRQCIHDALDKTDKDWLTPVDLGLFKGIDPEGAPAQPAPSPFLATPQMEEGEGESYTPTTLEAVQVALGEAVHNLLELDMIKPLGLWLEDELVLAALDRYRGDSRRAAEFLHTRPRNLSRWMPKIAAREAERNGSSLWQAPRRLLREWVRETPRTEQSPLALMGANLMAHLAELGGALSTADRARIAGVSTPTYLKRTREQGDRKQGV